MNDRGTSNTRKAEWLARSATELRSEERRVLAVLLLYGALICFAIWGAQAIDRHMEKQDESLAAGEAN